MRVAILFGGKSAEHEVSLQSAKNVADAIDKNKYEIVLIGIDKTGKWILGGSSQSLLDSHNPNLVKLNKEKSRYVALVPQSGGNLSLLDVRGESKKIDVIFPVLHGPFGEDGTVQGLLKLAGVPFVGAGVLGSAIGMDIDDFKKLDLRVGKVLEALRVEGSDKLIKMQVDFGEEKRQILAGIGKAYTPEDIIGKELVAVVNLETRMLMGFESQGMILAASDDIPVILVPQKEVSPGARVQ